MGKHWGHDNTLRDRVKIYETHCTISERDWQSLPRYESSHPTGIYAGKCWRRGFWLCWYGRVKVVSIRGEQYNQAIIGYARALVQ